MKKILLLFVVFILVLSCPKDNPLEPENEGDQLGACPDTRLIGKWKFYEYTSWNGGLYERFHHEIWEFDNNNKCYSYYKYWSYTGAGWINALKRSYSFYYKWEIVGDKIRHRLWNIVDSTWYEYPFEYINSTNIKINSVSLIKQ